MTPFRPLAALRDDLADREDLELRARGITERMAVALQGALLVRHAPAATADAFCASRLGSRWSGAYGSLPAGTELRLDCRTGRRGRLAGAA